MRVSCLLAVVCLLVCGGAPVASAGSVKVCVSVRVKTYRPRPPAKPPAPAPKAAAPTTPRAAPRAAPGRQPPAASGAAAKPAPAARPAPRPTPRAGVWQSPYVRYRRRGPPLLSASRWRRRRLRRPRVRRSPYPYPPQAYLRRLVEHFVTHTRGYVAVAKGCTERISIELYPLRKAWTVFARYSKRASEEKVDRLEFGEFSRFAERVVGALLHGKTMADTANLRTILKADSLRDYRTIRGTHHFTFGLGAAPKLAYLPTYDPWTDSTNTYHQVRYNVRFLTPMTFAVGYRGRFNAWGIDAYVRGGVGLQRESRLHNTDGGHVDLDGLFGVGLHFLRYARPHSMVSFYYGAGALFDLSFFSAIDSRSSRDRARFTTGGLGLNFVLGFEFMRASTAQFFIQLVATAPVYAVEVTPDAGPGSERVRAYIPELAATVGIMF